MVFYFILTFWPKWFVCPDLIIIFGNFMFTLLLLKAENLACSEILSKDLYR